MSEKRRASESIRAIRDAKRKSDPSTGEAQILTWPPCPGCSGTGQRTTVDANRGNYRGGRYRGGRCRWCKGSGAIEPDVMLGVLYHRWLRIYARNRAMGRCRRPR